MLLTGKVIDKSPEAVRRHPLLLGNPGHDCHNRHVVLPQELILGWKGRIQKANRFPEDLPFFLRVAALDGFRIGKAVGGADGLVLQPVMAVVQKER